MQRFHLAAMGVGAMLCLAAEVWPKEPERLRKGAASPFVLAEDGRPAGEDAPRSYASLAAGPWQLRLLPGHDEFTFTMYGCPHDVEQLKQLVAVMRKKGLGNGFDPGPAAKARSKPVFEYLATVGWPIISYPGYGDHQVVDGRCRLGEEDEAAVRILDGAGVFSAIQLGEWGYYFHNLSSVGSWWRAVYGKDFEAERHRMKPRGLDGYDTRAKTRRQCYDVIRKYFLTRNRRMRGRNMSVTGHSHYEAYAAEWGARVIGLELGENIAFSQSKLAFARGASRQWRRPWSVQVSPWFAGSCTTRGPLRMKGKYARGLDAGHSLSFYRRMWLHAWFGGAAMVTPENSIAIFFEAPKAPWKLTSHGQAAADVFAFMRRHDRGVPYTPVAIVLDHLAGYNAYKGRPWGTLENTPGDRETRDLFQHQLFAGSDHIHTRADPSNPEKSYLRPTPFGEIFDVLLSSAGSKVLQAYPVVLLVGDVTFNVGLVARLRGALRGGSRLLLHPRHVQALGKNFARLHDTGKVEVLQVWTNPATRRAAAISNRRLARLCAEHLAVAVEGDAVQYQVNRNRTGWVVELVHNGGVAKHPRRPAVVDRRAVARVTLRPRIPIRAAREWQSGKELPIDRPITITIPPGETVFVELTLPPRPPTTRAATAASTRPSG